MTVLPMLKFFFFFLLGKRELLAAWGRPFHDLYLNKMTPLYKCPHYSKLCPCHIVTIVVIQPQQHQTSKTDPITVAKTQSRALKPHRCTVLQFSNHSLLTLNSGRDLSNIQPAFNLLPASKFDTTEMKCLPSIFMAASSYLFICDQVCRYTASLGGSLRDVRMAGYIKLRLSAQPWSTATRKNASHFFYCSLF